MVTDIQTGKRLKNPPNKTDSTTSLKPSLVLHILINEPGSITSLKNKPFPKINVKCPARQRVNDHRNTKIN